MQTKDVNRLAILGYCFYKLNLECSACDFEEEENVIFLRMKIIVTRSTVCESFDLVN